LISQYGNLLHPYVHQREAGDAVTFWAGCGGVRAEVFARCGGFDESRATVAVEDIELGYRVSASGRRIVLRPEIQAKHLERWRLRRWAFTSFSARRLFEAVFPARGISTRGKCSGSHRLSLRHGTEELQQSELDARDPDYQVVTTVRAVRSGQPDG
jgi:GT2 family glycosyltransferase